jgi:hypothetical protein
VRFKVEQARTTFSFWPRQSSIAWRKALSHGARSASVNGKPRLFFDIVFGVKIVRIGEFPTQLAG